MNDAAVAIIARLGVTVDPRRAAQELPRAEQQTVMIAQALSLDARVLIVDEPSASLSDHEVQRLFGITQALRDEGVAVLYISHWLEEVFALATTVTVPRASMIAERVGTRHAGVLCADAQCCHG